MPAKMKMSLCSSPTSKIEITPGHGGDRQDKSRSYHQHAKRRNACSVARVAPATPSSRGAHPPPLNDSEELIGELKAARLDLALVAKPQGNASRGLIWRELPAALRVAGVRGCMDGPPSRAGRALRMDWVRPLAYGRKSRRTTRAQLAQGCAVRHGTTLGGCHRVACCGRLGVSVLPQPRSAQLAAYPVRVISLRSRAPFRALSRFGEAPTKATGMSKPSLMPSWRLSKSGQTFERCNLPAQALRKCKQSTAPQIWRRDYG